MQLGADSIVVLIQDELHKLKDKLETFWYTSTTGQGAKSLYQSMLLKKSFRVFRSSNLETQWAPPMKTKLAHQYLYDGLYTVKNVSLMVHCKCLMHPRIFAPSTQNTPFI